MNKKKDALGRGLDAFFPGEMLNEEVSDNEVVVELALADIRPNPYQPRKTFSPEALAELAASIEKQGVFQPIIVRQSSIKGYELIAGERRFRASKLAGKTQIPAIVREFDEESMMEIAILENLQREDLTPLEEAQAYNSLMENLHLTQAEVSQRLGKSRPYIANYLRLLSLPTAVKQMLQSEKLSMGQARTLLALKDKSKIIPLAEKTVAENLTVRNLEQLVQKLNGDVAPTKKKKKTTQNPYYRQSEKILSEKFGTKVAVKANAKTGKGKIEIDYLSTADFNRILEILEINLD
ncbi:ParB/RepB/Spo0J family partition protein [Ligilactobacillus ceti]|uniref:Chromosome partitioning protein, DNA-binding protein n=1 Tax=Ligilactobacillus ceti DSM 22408 TaxID=1122146 RepID=A0A0R2KJK3_9LACO|nr:ParB/RepB/Spo0J family partition protein [Ligilactobacillus ceti]KRN89550.1 chromosome partitioning protein, DNA-binding protein [Ligilactobacillus ceti DSM 22408]